MIPNQGYYIPLTSSALHVSRHLDSDVELLSLCLGETVGAGNVVGDLERNLAGAGERVARLIQIA